MNVKQLREFLSKYDDEAEVFLEEKDEIRPLEEIDTLPIRFYSHNNKYKETDNKTNFMTINSTRASGLIAKKEKVEVKKGIKFFVFF